MKYARMDANGKFFAENFDDFARAFTLAAHHGIVIFS
jgi:hypothetical protein